MSYVCWDLVRSFVSIQVLVVYITHMFYMSPTSESVICVTLVSGTYDTLGARGQYVVVKHSHTVIVKREMCT